MTTATGTRADGLTAIEAEVGVLLRRVRKVVADRAALVHPELQGVAYQLLGWIKENGPARASSAVCALQIDKGALSRQLQHLEELGLISRTPDPADGRASLVELTDDARARMGQIDEDRRMFVDERLADWSIEELNALADRLRRYNEALT